jgi:uncharacterized YigZ family protein
MKKYPIPASQARSEIIVINSRFIATAGPAFNIDQAKGFISRIRSEFADATHHVPAYLIGYGTSVTAHCSDDGEPSGTAGRPALAVLQGSGLGDIVLVVTRYFGGTKLGTGGLVRAYSDAVKSVLAILPIAQKQATHTVRVEIPYSLFDRVHLLVDQYNGRIVDKTFTANVTFSIQFPVEEFDPFQHALLEISAGHIKAEIIETNPNTIMLLDNGSEN